MPAGRFHHASEARTRYVTRTLPVRALLRGARLRFVAVIGRGARPAGGFHAGGGGSTGPPRRLCPWGARFGGAGRGLGAAWGGGPGLALPPPGPFGEKPRPMPRHEPLPGSTKAMPTGTRDDEN